MPTIATSSPFVPDNMALHTSTPEAEEARKIVSDLFAVITKQGNSDYLGENVSQLQHSLQAARLAQDAGHDNDTILAALLHDVGRFIPAADKMDSIIDSDGTYVGKARHEILGEHYLRQLGFSEKICQLVGAHVMAKRYLTAVERNYYDGLSASSKTTLKFQGGPLTAEEVLVAQKDPLLREKVAVRKYDDMAKDPGMVTPDLGEFTEMAVGALVRSRREGGEGDGRVGGTAGKIVE